MRKYRFYKDELGWFIDLKWFPFNRGYLAMVQGADTLLDILSEGKSEIILQVATSPIPYSDGVLEKEVDMGIAGGAFYKTKEGYTSLKAKEIKTTAPMLWLCPVTLWVFLRYPKKIYYKLV